MSVVRLRAAELIAGLTRPERSVAQVLQLAPPAHVTNEDVELAVWPCHRCPLRALALVTQHGNSHGSRSDAGRVQMVWRSSSMLCSRDCKCGPDGWNLRLPVLLDRRRFRASGLVMPLPVRGLHCRVGWEAVVGRSAAGAGGGAALVRRYGEGAPHGGRGGADAESDR